LITFENDDRAYLTWGRHESHSIRGQLSKKTQPSVFGPAPLVLFDDLHREADELDDRGLHKDVRHGSGGTRGLGHTKSGWSLDPVQVLLGLSELNGQGRLSKLP